MAVKEQKTTFVMDAKYYKQIRKMSAERKAMLFDAILLYNLTGENVDFSDDPALEMIFDIMRTDFDKNKERYEQFLEKFNKIQEEYAEFSKKTKV